MAELWRLPVVYVIENNQYGMGTWIGADRVETNWPKNGTTFNIPGKQADGMDVVAVRDAGEGGGASRSGNGPYLLEMKTYRLRGHSMTDPASTVPVRRCRRCASTTTASTPRGRSCRRWAWQRTS